MTLDDPSEAGVLSLPSGFFAHSSLLQDTQANDDLNSTEPLLDTTNPFTASKSAKLFDGSTITLNPKRIKPKVDHLSDSSSASLDLIDIDKLLSKVELKRAIKSSNSALRRANSSSGSRRRKNDGLWTDKYRPSTFMEVCSAGNDKSYRQMLHWLRKWSSLVFKEDMPPPPITSGAGGGSYGANAEPDHLGRPAKKILLVNGPVGMGKTTVTHLLAGQLGYSIQELSAANSMDPQLGSNHGGSALKQKIINALTSNSLTSGGKPTCLVIDEVDSAINSAEIIKVLIDLLYLDSRNKQSSAASAKGSQTKKPFQLNRPIICIANDIYASATNTNSSSSSSFAANFSIDKLRSHCEIVTFRKPMASRGARSGGNGLRTIKDYIMNINKREKLALNYRDVNEIVEVCEGDIRSCINFLQFNKFVESDDTGANDASDDSSSILKDTQMSWFAIVALLFKRNQNLSRDEDFASLLNLLTNGGGKSSTSSSNIVDKVVKGCFNRYLDAVSTQDDSVLKPSQLSDWLWFYDQADHGHGSAILDAYAPAVYLKFWSMFSDINQSRHNSSSSTSLVPAGIDFESFELGRQNKFIMRKVIEKLPIQVRISIGDGVESSNTIPGNFLPYLDKILTPIPFNNGGATSTISSSANNNSNSKFANHEKIAQIVKDFSFSLESHKDLDSGEIKLQISPELDTITIFDNALLPQSSSTTNKLIQSKRQWLFPLIKKELDNIESLKKRKTISSSSLAAAKENGDVTAKVKRSRLTNSADFFKGRYDNLSSQTSGGADLDGNGSHKKLDKSEEVSHIWVKYHEGFSNAVRINIGWDDLWVPPHEYVE